MKLVLTLDLQQDNGTSILKGSESLSTFVGSKAQFDATRTFMVGPEMLAFLNLQCWRASIGGFAIVGEPIAVTISQLKLV